MNANRGRLLFAAVALWSGAAVAAPVPAENNEPESMEPRPMEPGDNELKRQPPRIEPPGNGSPQSQPLKTEPENDDPRSTDLDGMIEAAVTELVDSAIAAARREVENAHTPLPVITRDGTGARGVQEFGRASSSGQRSGSSRVRGRGPEDRAEVARELQLLKREHERELAALEYAHERELWQAAQVFRQEAAKEDEAEAIDEVRARLRDKVELVHATFRGKLAERQARYEERQDAILNPRRGG